MNRNPKIAYAKKDKSGREKKSCWRSKCGECSEMFICSFLFANVGGKKAERLQNVKEIAFTRLTCFFSTGHVYKADKMEKQKEVKSKIEKEAADCKELTNGMGKDKPMEEADETSARDEVTAPVENEPARNNEGRNSQPADSDEDEAPTPPRKRPFFGADYLTKTLKAIREHREEKRKKDNEISEWDGLELPDLE